MGITKLDIQSSKSERPNVFLYDDYRVFLADIFEYYKLTKKMTLRKFSKVSGFKSHDMLKKIIDGKRNLSADGIEKICQGFELPQKDAQFLTQLIYFNQSKTSSERRFYAKQIAYSKKYQNTHPKRIATFNYFSKWYYVAIREMVALPNFKSDPKWIAEVVYPKVSVVEAKHALRDLEELGLIIQDDRGNFSQTDRDIETANEITSATVLDYHLQMLQKGQAAVENLPKEERNVSGVTIPMSKEKYREATEMVNQLREHLVEIGGQQQDAEEIFQFNFVLFPLTKIKEKT